MGKGSHSSDKKNVRSAFYFSNKCITNIDGWAFLLTVKGVSVLYFLLKTIFPKGGNVLSS